MYDLEITLICVIVGLGFLPFVRDFACWLVNYKQTMKTLEDIKSRLESISEKLDKLTGESENGNNSEYQ